MLKFASLIVLLGKSVADCGLRFSGETMVGLRTLAGLTAVCLTVASCITPNEYALQVGAAPETAAKLRVMQTRSFPVRDEIALLASATQALQDLGFTLNESASDLGLLAAAKSRDAEESGQVAGQVALMVVLALLGSAHSPVWDKEQTIFVTLATRPLAETGETELRVSFDRRVINNHEQLWKAELIDDAEIYREFFDKLSTGIHLEGART